MKVAQVLTFLKEFAPPQAVVSGQVLLFTFGLFFSSKTNTTILLGVPRPVELVIMVMFGLFCYALSFLASKRLVLWKDTLGWMFSVKLKKYGLVWTLFILPLIVAVGEETFFRGFLLPNIGLLPETLLFSIYHIRANTKSLLLAAIAFILGWILGVAYLKTGNLIVPIAAHFSILFFLGFGFNLSKDNKI